MEEMSVSTKGKNPKQGLASAEELTSIELSEGRASPYHRLTN